MFLGSASDSDWTISEDRIDKEEMRFQETIFTLGNGYLGSRGILEEGYEEGYAGTYIAGIYDRSDAQSFEIVNVPNPLVMEIHVDGKKLSADEMEVVEHCRVLDLRNAVLLRRTVFMHAGRRYEYESRRFFSLEDMHIGVVHLSFRSLDSDAPVVIKHKIDGATRNGMQAIGTPVKHYAVTDSLDPGNGLSYFQAETNDLGRSIGIATAATIKGGKPKSEVETECRMNEESITREYSFGVRKGVRHEFEQYISIYTSRETGYDIKAACLDGVETARKRGVSYLLRQHTGAWEKRWESSDIVIKGDPSAQKALRFSMYHLLIAAPPQDLDVSIPAKALAGEWYQGHVFWDTEIFMLPFFVHTQPKLARDLLMYRYRRLDQAREGAQAQEYKGALWPWESADSGKDETPKTWVNFDGTVIPVYNSTREHHIASDVVYSISLYHQLTSDEDFMLRYGSEMVFETARFWASRVVCDEKSGSYEIREVIGPNEFQECVDNNSYTNGLARWTLRYAADLYDRLRKGYPGRLQAITEKIGLEVQEVDTWREISEGIVFLIRPNGLIEEFEGYFERKDVTISEWDENGMPVWPSEVALAEVKETQLIKQADVVLLLHLLSNEFSLDTKRTNLDYYEKRTTHKSSLSTSSYAIIAHEVGDVEKAYMLFTRAANTDLDNSHGNTDHGIHAAALGGAWQALVHGFARLRVKDGVLSINPALPQLWQSVSFRIWFRGSLIEIAFSKDETEASMLKGRKGVDVEIYGSRQVLHPGNVVRGKR